MSCIGVLSMRTAFFCVDETVSHGWGMYFCFADGKSVRNDRLKR